MLSQSPNTLLQWTAKKRAAPEQTVRWENDDTVRTVGDDFEIQ